MNAELLDAYVLNILAKSGLNETCHDYENWISRLEKEGYKIHKYAYEILRELGSVSVQESGDAEHSGATFNFNAFYAGSGEYDRVEEFENASSDKLYPIGEYQQYFIYAGESHKIYLGNWNFFAAAGDSIEDLLNNIFKRNYEPTKIPLERG